MTSQEWSLEDVLSLLFGEEAKFIVPRLHTHQVRKWHWLEMDKSIVLAQN